VPANLTLKKKIQNVPGLILVAYLYFDSLLSTITNRKNFQIIPSQIYPLK